MRFDIMNAEFRERHDPRKGKVDFTQMAADWKQMSEYENEIMNLQQELTKICVANIMSQLKITDPSKIILMPTRFDLETLYKVYYLDIIIGSIKTKLDFSNYTYSLIFEPK